MRPFIPPGNLSKATGLHTARRPAKTYQEHDVYFSNNKLSILGRLSFPFFPAQNYSTFVWGLLQPRTIDTQRIQDQGYIPWKSQAVTG